MAYLLPTALGGTDAEPRRADARPFAYGSLPLSAMVSPSKGRAKYFFFLPRRPALSAGGTAWRALPSIRHAATLVIFEETAMHRLASVILVAVIAALLQAPAGADDKG